MLLTNSSMHNKWSTKHKVYDLLKKGLLWSVALRTLLLNQMQLFVFVRWIEIEHEKCTLGVCFFLLLSNVFWCIGMGTRGIYCMCCMNSNTDENLLLLSCRIMLLRLALRLCLPNEIACVGLITFAEMGSSHSVRFVLNLVVEFFQQIFAIYIFFGMQKSQESQYSYVLYMPVSWRCCFHHTFWVKTSTCWIVSWEREWLTETGLVFGCVFRGGWLSYPWYECVGKWFLGCSSLLTREKNQPRQMNCHFVSTTLLE